MVEDKASLIVGALRQRPHLLNAVMSGLSDIVVVGPWIHQPAAPPDENDVCAYGEYWYRLFLHNPPGGWPENIDSSTDIEVNAVIIDSDNLVPPGGDPLLTLRMHPNWKREKVVTFQEGKELADQRLRDLGYVLMD